MRDKRSWLWLNDLDEIKWTPSLWPSLSIEYRHCDIPTEWMDGWMDKMISCLMEKLIMTSDSSLSPPHHYTRGSGFTITDSWCIDSWCIDSYCVGYWACGWIGWGGKWCLVELPKYKGWAVTTWILFASANLCRASYLFLSELSSILTTSFSLCNLSTSFLNWSFSVSRTSFCEILFSLQFAAYPRFLSVLRRCFNLMISSLVMPFSMRLSSLTERAISSSSDSCFDDGTSICRPSDLICERNIWNREANGSI